MGGSLFVMDCACGVVTFFVCVCEWCISSLVCIVAVLYVCISDEHSVYCVCGYIRLRIVSCLFVYDRDHKSK